MIEIKKTQVKTEEISKMILAKSATSKETLETPIIYQNNG